MGTNDDKNLSSVGVYSKLKSLGRLVEKNEKLKKIIYGIGTLVLLFFMMAWLSGTFIVKVKPGEVEPSSLQVKAGKAFPVERRIYPFEAEQIGTVKTRTDTWVSSRIMAQVKEILVSDGSSVQGVETGSPTILARLDDRDLKARVRQAESNLQAARRGVEIAKAQVESAKANLSSAKAQKDRVSSDYRRYQELYKQGAVTGQQLEHMKAQFITAEAQYSTAYNQVQSAQSELSRMEAQVSQAEAALSEARTMLDYTVIRAPFSGKVIKKMIEVGMMVSPGQPLFYIETPGQPELHAWVAESLLPYISVGQKLEVMIDAVRRKVSGTIREIVPQSESPARTVLVKIALPPERDLVNGMFGRFNVTCGTYSTLVIPRDAVKEVGQIRIVNVVKPDGSMVRRFITIGRVREDLVEVLSGLDDGEKVVVP